MLVAASLQGAGDPPGAERVEQLLRQVGPAVEAETRGKEGERAATALSALPPESIPDLVTLLARGAFQDGEALSEEQAELLVAKLASFPRPVLRTTLEKEAKRELDGGTRSAWLRVIARIGLASDVGLAVRIAAPDPKGADFVQADLQQAITEILRRDPSAAGALRRPIVEGSVALASTLVHAAGESGCFRALPVLVELLGFEESLDVALLSAIGRLSERAPKPIDEALLSEVQRQLESADVQCQREAALACGRAEDSGATALLIELLAHEERGVREAATWALERITGQHFSAQKRWESWLREEERWFEQELPRTSAGLSGKAPTAIRALGTILEHRHRRHELALEVVPALEHADQTVRTLACLALQRLGSTAAVPELTACLEDDDPRVRRAAAEALQSLGIRPPQEADGELPATLKIPDERVDHS